jgi:dihydroflavonol-4-reductase
VITLEIKNILITGSSGYLGRNLYNHLSKKYNVIGLRHKNEAKQQKSIAGDIMDRSSLRKAMNNIDCVIHCAALVGGNWSRNDYEVNSKGTENVVEVAIGTSVLKVIHLSTLAVVDEFIDHFNDDEKICYAKKYRNHYTQSKIQAEKYILESKDKIDVVILRPGWIWGPGERSIEELFEMIKHKRFIFIGNGKNLTYFTYIDNIIQAIELTIKTNNLGSGEVFNITDGMKITMAEFINAIALELDVKPITRSVPKSIAYTMAFFSEKINAKSHITRHNVSIMSRNLGFNIGKAERILGYMPNQNIKNHIGIIKKNIL